MVYFTRKPPERHCSRCNKWYYRVNKIRVWDQQNPGHRVGWHLTEILLCTNCMRATEAQRMAVISSVTVVSPLKKKMEEAVIEIDQLRKIIDEKLIG